MRVAGGRQRVLVGFAAFGVFWGAWGAALPALQRRSGADDGELGLAFVLVGLGALVAMRATGVLRDANLGPSMRLFARNAWSRVLKLMYPSRTRGSLSVCKDEYERSRPH
jgi:hypothetical protein